MFDADAAAEGGYTVMGEGALLAALDQERTGRMRDIVATIQAEQDEAIRADLAGILVVAGGPGTGKTAVALHRAAYLLYTHRKRLASQGVLLVGPSPIFLRYIDEVLPSLGEDEVALATPAALKPRMRVRGTESVAAAAVKGDARMAKVIAAAVGDRERPMPRDVVARRSTATCCGSAGATPPASSERAHARRGSHNERRPFVASMVLDHFRREYRRALVRAYRADRARLDPQATLDIATRSFRGHRRGSDGGGRARPRRGRAARVGRRAHRARCGARPRCARPSIACGRCSAGPSWSTTSSGSRRSSAPRRTGRSPMPSGGCCSANG